MWQWLGTLVGPVTSIVKGWQDRKKVKLENELAIAKATTEAKIARLRQSQTADIAWENTALDKSGIKDEVMMIVILTPMVMCFFPGGAELVREGFEAMNESLPPFWEKAFLATIAVSYGLRKFTDFKRERKGE